MIQALNRPNIFDDGQCEDINRAQLDVTYDFVFVDEESFKKYSPKSFADLAANFRQYKDA